MLIFFGILILIAALLLGIVILIQNPKGGDVAGGLSGISTQLIGVKQTTDILEKGTWLFGGLVALLCIISPLFIPKDGSRNSVNDNIIKNAPISAPVNNAVTPANTATPIQSAPAPTADPAQGMQTPPAGTAPVTTQPQVAPTPAPNQPAPVKN